MSRQVASYRVLAMVASAAALLAVTRGPAAAAAGKPDDFRWMHGANYVPSYAATDVEMWLHYDHAVIARELGYAKKMGLNCVRVFLQSLVFGGIECMRATGTEKPDTSGRFIFGGGQVISTVVELTDPIQARSIVPYGQSRRSESRHYADQTHLYSEGRMRPAWHA